MSKTVFFLIVLVIVLIIGGVAMMFFGENEGEQSEPPVYEQFEGRGATE